MNLLLLLTIAISTSFAQKDRPMRLKIIGFDEQNKPIMSGVLSLDNKLAQRMAQRQEESCSEGMGALKGYCAQYQGLVTEEEDDSKKCDLIQNQISLTLDPNGEINLYSGNAPNEVVQSRAFFSSRINYEPKTTTVELSARTCRPINGIHFPGDDCKRQRLAGAFNYFNRARHFSGFYSIIDERNGQSCRYRLSLDQKD